MNNSKEWIEEVISSFSTFELYPSLLWIRGLFLCCPVPIKSCCLFQVFLCLCLFSWSPFCCLSSPVFYVPGYVTNTFVIKGGNFLSDIWHTSSFIWISVLGLRYSFRSLVSFLVFCVRDVLNRIHVSVWSFSISSLTWRLVELCLVDIGSTVGRKYLAQTTLIHSERLQTAKELE